MRKKLFSFILLVSAFITFFTFDHKNTAAASDKLNVVTTLHFYGETAKAVLGDHGIVTSFITSLTLIPTTLKQQLKQLDRFQSRSCYL